MSHKLLGDLLLLLLLLTWTPLQPSLFTLNKYLAEVGMTPYTKTKAGQLYYPDRKMKEITESMKQWILSEPDDDDSEMIRQLKEQKRRMNENSYCSTSKLVCQKDRE